MEHRKWMSFFLFHLNNLMLSLLVHDGYEGGDIAKKYITCLRVFNDLDHRLFLYLHKSLKELINKS